MKVKEQLGILKLLKSLSLMTLSSKIFSWVASAIR
jgi:hypothetical protein